MYYLHNQSQCYTILCGLRIGGIKTIQKCKWECLYWQHGIWTSPWSHFKKPASIVQMHGTTTLPFPFFPLPRKIWSEFIGVCIMRRLRWAERGRVIPRTEGQAFWGSWLSTPALWCMHSCVPATTPSKSKVLLRHRLHKTHTVRLYQYRCYLHDFFQPKTRNETKMNDVWIWEHQMHYLQQHGQGLKKRIRMVCIYIIMPFLRRMLFQIYKLYIYIYKPHTQHTTPKYASIFYIIIKHVYKYVYMYTIIL